MLLGAVPMNMDKLCKFGPHDRSVALATALWLVLASCGFGQQAVSLIASPAHSRASLREFTPTARMSTPREYFQVVLLKNGLVLIVDGDPSTVPAPAELFDPSIQRFLPAGRPAVSRYAFTATLLPDGMVLITGGYDQGHPLDLAELYDPKSRQFRTIKGMNSPRYQPHSHLATQWKGLNRRRHDFRIDSP